MLNFDLIVVFLVLLFILISLYTELLGASFTFLIAVVTLGVFGVLTPSEILSGFANEQIAVILMLLLLGEIIRKTSVLEYVFDRVFSSAKSPKGFLGRIMIFVTGFSAFLNNTPLVAVMMPYVHNWCKKNDISPSKFLIPLSYAAIMGGCATLIGTSTNLIVNGLLQDQTIIPELKSLNIFDFSFVGVPMIIIGFFFIRFFGERLLPTSIDVSSNFSDNSRKYIVHAQVRGNSHLIGKTLEDADLIKSKGLILTNIVRGKYKISKITESIILENEDLLIFAGETEAITEMINIRSGLTLPMVGMLHRKKRTEVVEVVVSHKSTLVNKSAKNINFRAKYDAALIAVHRNDEKISGKLENVTFKAGDVLLLFGGDDFVSRTGDTQDFYFISKVKDFRKVEAYKVVVLLGGTISAILLAAFGMLSLFMGLVILLLSLLAINVVNPKDLHKSLDLNLALIIALSLALGTAMIKSGAADLIAGLIISAFLPFGKIILLAGIYLITTFLAAYITNTATVAIVFPISLTMAANLDLDPMPFILVVSFGAAANFMTPIGYQTNLMVYGPGGYTFKDFFKIGFPLTMLYMAVTVTILSLMYFN